MKLFIRIVVDGRKILIYNLNIIIYQLIKSLEREYEIQKGIDIHLFDYLLV